MDAGLNSAQSVSSNRERFVGEILLGLRIDDVPPAALLAEMTRAMRDRDRLLVAHVNAWLLTLAKKQSWLAAWMQRADIVYIDGTGAQWAASLLAGRWLHRSTAPEWIDELGRQMARQGSSIFWLGARPGAIEQAARNHAAATGVTIAGVHHGFFDKTPGSAENEAVVDAINRSGAAFLVVNMGMPVQERWLHDNWHKLDVPVALVSGALAERTAGLVSRPPAWVSRFGLEWLTRLVVEPRRLWRRYLIGLPILAFQVAEELAANGSKRIGSALRGRVKSRRAERDRL